MDLPAWRYARTARRAMGHVRSLTVPGNPSKAGQHGLISSFDFGDEIMPNHGAWEARTIEVSLEPLQHPLAGPDAGAPSRLSERAPHVRQDLFALSL